jgi:PAS domain S-box-containing protein
MSKPLVARARPNGRAVARLEAGPGALQTEPPPAESIWRTLVENLPDIVARFDPQLRHVYVSPAVERVTGRPPLDYLGKTNRELGIPAQLELTWDEALRRVFATGKPEEVQFEFRSPAGLRYFDARILPERDGNGDVTTVLSVSRDVTELRLAYEGEQRARRAADAVSVEQVRATALRMQALSRRLVEAQESERRSIARELHDEAGQALASLRFGLRLLEREIGEGGGVGGRVAELIQTTDAVIDGLHRLAADLRPASLDHLGLDAALRQYTRAAAAKFGLDVHFKARGFTGDRLPTVVETALYRVVQEALTNVVRHARATRVDVLVEHRGDRVFVMVEDNGVGFDLEQARQGDHFGLLGLRERAEALGGTLTVESSPGAGTTVVAEVASADSHPDR